MKKTWILVGVAALAFGVLNAVAEDSTVNRPAMPMGQGMQQGMGQGMMRGGMQPMTDDRESAGIPARMKTRHLARMRSHLETINEVVDAMARGDFNQASESVRNNLAMRPGMGAGMGVGMGMGMGQGMRAGTGQGAGGMCKGMPNKEFRALGMAFHESAATLADVLKGGDMKNSLRALNNTMNYCIQCHASYRQ